MTFVCQGIADQVKNTTTFERSVVAGVANVCMQRVAEMQSGDQLLGRRSDLPGCHGVAVADRLVSGDLEISRHDVVSCGGDLGVVHQAELIASLRQVILPGLPPGGDVIDWLAAGRTADDLVELCRQSPEYAAR